jgi:autotransporter strand-loop-strand O-heptosyltransferase
VKVVPEGVDVETFTADKSNQAEVAISLARRMDAKPFTFVHVGQWQPRKSTLEIIQAFLKAFPNNHRNLEERIESAHVRLELSVDTLFPSDEYKSTEERLKASGIEDSRISVVHFEERDDYIRRLQQADCFVSCSRGEGWGLPIIEAMACGIPTIVADWGGSTEYAGDAIRIPISKLIKPFGIYGNWDVPGQWCEPDYNFLREMMIQVKKEYGRFKQEALKTSDKIHVKFSWEAAANKAFDVLEQLHADTFRRTAFVTESATKSVAKLVPANPEADVRYYAAMHGFEIQEMSKSKSVFVIGTWPNSPEKMDALKETITQVKAYGLPVLISTHFALPPEIVEMVDYVIYEKKNVLSGDWTPTYLRWVPGKIKESKKSSIPYHGVACLNAICNAVDFCYPKFARMLYLEYDCEVDIDDLVKAAFNTNKPFTGVRYVASNEQRWVKTDIWAAETEFLWDNLKNVESWEEYVASMKDVDKEFPLEKYFFDKIGENNINFVKIDTHNRFDQVDREVWENDIINVNFTDGAGLSIAGISKRKYRVSYNAGNKNIYSLEQAVGMWSQASPKFYLPWEITATLDGKEVFNCKLDLKDKRVLISFGSKAVGDTIAWIPYIDEFRKKHGCHVVCSGWWQEIFDYPEIEFVKPGEQVKDIYAVYTVGCFDDQLDKNPVNWREVPLQKVATDILGLEYKPLKAKLRPVINHLPIEGPYICFSQFSTMRNKIWNRNGAWQKIIDYCNSLGYKCVCVSSEPSVLKNIVSRTGQSIQNTIEDIKGCEFYIGLNHGPAWIAYVLDKPTIMITGVSEEWNDFPNPHRIAINHEVCGVGCFNDPGLKIDRGWEWCPRNKDYACTKEITEDRVIEEINKIRGDSHAGNTKKGRTRKGAGAHAQSGSRVRNNARKSESARAASECH